jgi:hypothetical protein
MVTGRDVSDAGTDVRDDPCAFMAEHDRHRVAEGSIRQ